jgi:hypothetical protein
MSNIVPQEIIETRIIFVRGKKVMLDRGTPYRDMGKMSRWVGIRAYGGYTVNPAGVLYSSLPLHKSEGRGAG